MTLYTQLSDIHQRVLAGFKYTDDKDQFGMDEHWHLPEDVDNVTGDCDDFAIACRSLVRDLDCATRLAICMTETGEWHLVCTANEYVLDNRQRRVYSREELEYKGYKFHYVSGLEAHDPWEKLQ